MGTNATMLLGDSQETLVEAQTQSSLSGFYGTVGADPGSLWYFLVGYQNFAGTTTTNQQAQVKITFKVKWRQPTPTAVQSIDTTWWGTEIVADEWIEKMKAIQQPRKAGIKPGQGVTESKLGLGEFKALGAISKDITVKAPVAPAATGKPEESKRPLDDDLDEDEEALFRSFKKFVEYRRHTIAGQTAADKQADAFENADFSGGGAPRKGLGIL